MTHEEHLAILRTYIERFKNWEPKRADRYRNLPFGMGAGIKHAVWMAHELVRRLEAGEESSPGQADRWIGFMQAVFWTHGFYSIDEMAKMNTLSKEKEVKAHDES